MSNDVQDQNEEHDGEDNLVELREAAKRGRTAAQEAAALKRENAFLKAGVPTDSPLGEMFAKAYDGELTAEAISEAASKIGLLGGNDATSQPDAQPPASEQIRQTLNEGNPTSVSTTDDRGPDPTDNALRSFQTERLQIGEENARLAAFDRMVVAGANGDQRAIFDADRFMSDARAFGHGADV